VGIITNDDDDDEDGVGADVVAATEFNSKS
jgi:hypothetical protein